MVMHRFAILIAFLFLSGMGYSQIKRVNTSIEVISTMISEIEMDYEIDRLPDSVSFRVIQFQKMEISNLEIMMGDEVLPHQITSPDYPLIEGHFRVPPQQGDVLTVRYNTTTSRGKNVIPLVLLDLTPPAAEAGVFKAVIRQPRKFVIRQVFPSRPWQQSRKKSQFDLSVIPAVIKFDLAYSYAGLVTTSFVLELVVFVMIALLLLLGWRRFRQQANG